jgi:hypothetical protein
MLDEHDLREEAVRRLCRFVGIDEASESNWLCLIDELAYKGIVTHRSGDGWYS